jgi:hypothetical protein
MKRIDAIKTIAEDKIRRSRCRSYSYAMIEAEEIVSALEVLKMIVFDDPLPGSLPEVKS